MPVITLETIIESPAKRVFDLSRSVDLHKMSIAPTNEEAISGVTTGLIGLGESVTWRAKHFALYQTLTTKITKQVRGGTLVPLFFVLMGVYKWLN